MGRIRVLLVFSGAAGLAYQVVWSHLLKQTFGVTVYAVATVLATFLAGLALGSMVVGRRVDRSRDPLALYGWLEIGIAVAALLGWLALAAVEPVDAWAANRWGPASVALIATRLALSAVVILPSTFLMGGTLPAITRAVVARPGTLGREISVLYALNTLGAVGGSLAAGFALIRLVGLPGTLWIAVGVNLLVGIAALGMARSPRRAPTATVEQTAAAQVRQPPPRGLLAVVALCGFVTLGLEVVWTRVLVQLIGTTAYAFVTMLASFLVGLSLGGFVARVAVDRLRDVRGGFAWLQLGVAASTLATLPWIDAGLAHDWLTGWGARPAQLAAVRFAVSLLVMLVPATLIGMSFPLAARLWTRDLEHVGRDLGTVLGWNTVGNIAGALGAGFALVPLLGLQRSLVVLALLGLVAAAWGFAGMARPTGRLGGTALVAAGSVACLLLVLTWEPRPFRLWGESPDDEVLYYKEGVVSTVKVVRRAGKRDQLWMGVDAVMIGQSLGGVDPKQQSLAHFPFLLRERPLRRVLSIGLGTGIVAGEVVRHEDVESLECLEISPAVIEAARYFEAFNHGALDHPRVRVINDDGVSYLRRSAGTYDAIISDGKSRTTHAANGLFFSRDYYELCSDHLDPDGVMIQWVPLSLPPAELRIVLRTFRQTFAHTYVWVSPPHACYLVGTELPLELDPRRIQDVLDSPAAAGLRRYGLRRASDFLAMLVADEVSLDPWLARESTVNTLAHPVLEFYSARAHAMPPDERTDHNLLGLLAAGRHPLDHVTLGELPTELAIQRWAAGRLAFVRREIDQSPAISPGRIVGQLGEIVRSTAPRSGAGYTAAALYQLALSHVPDSGELHGALGDLLRAQGRIARAIRHYRSAVVLDPTNAVAHARLGQTLLSAGRFDPALEHLREVVRLQPDAPMALSGIAVILATHPDPERRRPAEAIRTARRASELTDHADPTVLDTLARAYASAEQLERAVATASAALSAATSVGAHQLAAEIRLRLEGYRARLEPRAGLGP